MAQAFRDPGVHDHSAITTFLFTDIEGSTQLWEREPARMESALARHDELARSAVEAHHGSVVKTTGDGICAAFDDPKDAVAAALRFQQALSDPSATGGVTLRARCGLHAGVAERRDNDYFGSVLNRAARIMAAAHGGQVLVSQALAVLLADRPPADVAFVDLGAVRLRDLASPERVFQVAHPALRREFPALRSLESTPNNLPQQMTSFIGRERELTEVGRTLLRARLVTILGAGGLGKTRLSLQAAADVQEDYPEGVWLVELAALTDARLVPQAVASALGVKEEAGRPVLEALLKAIRDRHLLVILDNCEHLLQACAETVAQLLQAGPRVKVLATSREPLHVAGETIFPLPALAVPDPGDRPMLADLARFEAVRLFVERAVAAQPAFRLTGENAATVVDICRRLDGIPLAIELAAARVRALSVQNIGERLANRFSLLTGGDRTALPRQQTLRASIDWSFHLLVEAERALLARLAVFAGGWTLEAAEAVGSGGAIVEGEMLHLLTQLVEKSLVAVEAEGARYRLLETVRQYAAERLRETGEGDAVRTRHLRYFVSWAETVRPALVGPDQAKWLARLELEHENLLAARAWCEHSPEGADLGLRLASAAKRYWVIRGLLDLGYRVTVDALQHAGAQQRSLARCRGLNDAGQLACFMGRYGEARTFLEDSLAIARELGDDRRVTVVLQPLGLASLGLGDRARARGHYEEGLALALRLGDKREIAGAKNSLAQLYRVEGELDAAEPLYEDVVALTRELGDGESLAVGLLNLAMVAIGRAQTDRAHALLREVLAIAQQIGSKSAGLSALEVSAGLAAAAGEPERAARYFGAAEAQTGQTGLHRDPADEAFLRPLIVAAGRSAGEPVFAAASAAGSALTYDEALSEVSAWIGRAQR